MWPPSIPWPRSIPACAGEPNAAESELESGGVYPRVCGGTVKRGIGMPRRRGLSPRVRGNPGRVTATTAQHRSIPACAGEPP